MVTAQIYDAAARRKSYDILAKVHPPQGLTAAPAPLARPAAAARVTAEKTPSAEGFWEDNMHIYQMGRDAPRWH